jgi:hypothetical protein
MSYPNEDVDAFEFRMHDPVTGDWFYQTAPSWGEFERTLISVSRHRGHPMELWAIRREDADYQEPEAPWMESDGFLLPWKRIARIGGHQIDWSPSMNGPSMGVVEGHDPYDLSSVPHQTVTRARHLLQDASRDMLRCGESGIVMGWWVESYTLGCRDAANEPKHLEILKEHERDGFSRIMFDEGSGAFVTMHPQRRRKLCR